MCEYLRPVVALEWLKACCYLSTDMITCDAKLYNRRNNSLNIFDDSKKATSRGFVDDRNTHPHTVTGGLTNALIAVHVTSQFLYTRHW